MRSILLVLVILFAPFSAAYPQQAEDIAILKQRAASGDAWAQLNLGAAYDNGLGIERDVERALYWYQLAAEQGLAEAQFNLAHLLVEEEISTVAAAEWMHKAAEQGMVDAQYLLGIIYAEGIGVEVDDAKARLWLQRAIEQGQTDAAQFMKNHYGHTGQ
jgi:hypothetical protein